MDTDVPRRILSRSWSTEVNGGYNCQNRAIYEWDRNVARAKRAAKCRHTYPLTVFFQAALTGNPMGTFKIEHEAAPGAHVMHLVAEMENGNIEGIPAMKKGYRYRLQYGGKALHDDDFLDYVVAADNPIVTVLRIREAAETASLCSDSDGAYLAVPVEAGVPSTDLRHAGERIAFDGNAYTRHEFIQYYGEHDGAYFWDRAAPCVPLPHSAFAATGDAIHRTATPKRFQPEPGQYDTAERID